MFTFGMILLEMSCLLPSSELYENGFINEKMLLKRIEGSTITNDQMISKAIKHLLQLDQDKRLKIGDIFKNEEWLKMRKVVYYPSKTDFFKYKNFEGVIEYDKTTSIGEALDKDLCMIRGTFKNGVFEGINVRQFKDTLEMGIFVEEKLVEGQVIKKNNYVDIGKFKDGQTIQGVRIALNVQTMNKNNKNIYGFIGEFEGGEPRSGKFIYSDNSEQFV